MRLRILPLIALLLAAVLIGCEGPKSFKIIGEMDPGTNININVQYYGGHAVQSSIIPVRDGHFEAELSSPFPTLVEFRDNENRLLALACGANGDEIQMTIDRRNPFNIKLSGTDLNEQFAAALRQYADSLASSDASTVNSAVESYISENPTSEAATLMYVAFYDASIDPLKADSVLNLIAHEAQLASILDAYAWQLRPFSDPLSYRDIPDIKYRTQESDSLITFSIKDKKLSFIALSNENSWRADSVTPHLKDIYKKYAKDEDFQMLDLGVFTDVNVWRGVTARDSADWAQGWVPGGSLGDIPYHLAIPTLPYYIVTDSTGVQIFRGTSPQDAAEAIKERLKK